MENIPVTVAGAWAADEAPPSKLTLAREIKELHYQSISNRFTTQGEGGKKKIHPHKKTLSLPNKFKLHMPGMYQCYSIVSELSKVMNVKVKL